MKEFNYQDYLRYQKLKRIETNGIFCLRDVNSFYRLESIKVDKPHDKIFKTVLGEKKQVVRFFK